MTSQMLRRLARLLAVAGLIVLLAACAKDAPQDALAPEGPISRQLDGLFRPVFWIAAVVFFLVEGLIVYAAWKFRDRGQRDEPKQIHGNTKLEIGWTLAPALLLAGIAIPMVITIFDVAADRDADDVTVKVIAKQWWWEFEYLSEGQPHPITANELVIPVDREVYLELESVDVIHSFWIPKLAGKQDVVPGRTNTLQLIADEPGKTYEGQCAEFCAISHANMRLRAITMTQEDFDAWVEEQRADAVTPTAGDAKAGYDLFFSSELATQLQGNNCINCHAIRGTDAAARVGPDLTHFASRERFAGAILDVDEPGALEAWIRNTRELKPGVVMPVFEGLLTDEQIRLLAAYIMSLT